MMITLSSLFLILCSLYGEGVMGFLSPSTTMKPSFWLQETSLRAVKSIESTPNPSSFKLTLDEPIISGNGRTFSNANEDGCPEAIKVILGTFGMESVYAMPGWVCVNKISSNSHSWDNLLPQCVAALGGAPAGSEAFGSLNRLMISKELSTDLSTADNELCVKIRLQMSNGIPIQVEASDGLLTKRQALSARFATTMNAFIMEEEKKGGSKMKFFEGRSWIASGTLYTETLEEALTTAVGDVEALYTDDQLALLVNSIPRSQHNLISTVDILDLKSTLDKTALRAVEQLCSIIDGYRIKEEASEDERAALILLIGFVQESSGSVSARRMAIAYLGSCSYIASPSFTPYKDSIFNCLSWAFCGEKSAGLRRTAGDALSDLGDPRAVTPAVDQLIRDPSKLVRWRAARILGELGGCDEAGGSVRRSAVAALEAAAQVDGQSFEILFECSSSLSALTSEDSSARPGMPVWMQMTKKSSE